LNGAECYTAALCIIVLSGKVFGEHDQVLAEKTPGDVRGVRQMANTLMTMTSRWQTEESRIIDSLLLNDLRGVSVHAFEATSDNPLHAINSRFLRSFFSRRAGEFS